MAKFTSDDVLDAACDEVALANVMTACSAQPTTRTEAVTTFMLASVAMTPGDGNDYTVQNGATNGRRVTTAVKNGVAVTNTGTANHVALCDATRLLSVTTCPNANLDSAGTVDFPAWSDEYDDPT